MDEYLLMEESNNNVFIKEFVVIAHELLNHNWALYSTVLNSLKDFCDQMELPIAYVASGIETVVSSLFV